MMIVTDQLAKDYNGVRGLAPISFEVQAGEHVVVCMVYVSHD